MEISFFELTLLGASLGFLVYMWTIMTSHLSMRKQLLKIDGPKGYPFIGNAIDLTVAREDLIPLLRSWIDNYKSNKLVKLTLPLKYYIIPTDARLLENILGSSQHIEKSDDYRFLQPWLGTGLLTSGGTKWHSRRKMLTPSFHFKILEDFIDIFNEQSEILISKLRKETEKPFDIFPFITLCTLDIIYESAMGRCINAQGNKDSDYVKAVYGITKIIHARQKHPWMWPNWIFSRLPAGKKHKAYLQTLHSFTRKVIRERKAERKDNLSRNKKASGDKRLAFLDLLLEANENGQRLFDDGIREEVDTFMFEGHHTTGSAISWTLYLLGHYPEIQKKVQRELDCVFGTEIRQITSENLKELKYLDLVIKESLRLYPPVPVFERKLKQEVTLGNFNIPAGVILVIAPILLHKDENLFPNPLEFIPERFQTENGRDNSIPYSYIPFSAGPRNCIGKKFALMEEKIILSHILHSFYLESVTSRENLKPLLEFILRPKEGILVKLTPRNLDDIEITKL